MKTILVVGAGFMGAGIAQVCAQAGFNVALTDNNHQTLDKALKSLRWSVEKLAGKGLLGEDPHVICDRVTPHKDYRAAAQADWIIEAVFEIEELKHEIFRELDRLSRPDIPLATNTSSIPVSRIAAVTRRPERVLGLHFFGPVPLMALVEVVKGQKTAEEVFERGVDFVRSLGKTPVRVKKDIPLFVMNRIFSAAFREAVELVARGVVTPEDADLGMRLGYGWSAGPFEVVDNAGLDTFVLIGQSMRALGETHLAPRTDLIEEMVREGRLGRKAGRGFYKYGPDGRRIPWDE